jgi:5-(carboxyamino)imidazole ribonucleotide mutase
MSEKAPQAQVGIIMGSDSDLPVMEQAALMLEELEIPYEISIVSAHRTPEKMVSYAKEAAKRGIRVIIAGAGGAAHLPGMVASLTHLPVIGVPVKSKAMNGIDSLYSIVQMPPGVPVATMAIDGAKNAGLFAGKILAITDKEVEQKLIAYREFSAEAVQEKAELLEQIGPIEYLKNMDL